MCGTDTAGRGALEPPPERGARTKLYSTENSSSANRILRPRPKETPDQIHDTNEGFYIDLCSEGLWIPGSLTELPEVSGTGAKVLQNFQKFQVSWHGRTELTVPGG